MKFRVHKFAIEENNCFHPLSMTMLIEGTLALTKYNGFIQFYMISIDSVIT